MTGQVTITPSGHVYPVEATESILEGGLKSGLALAYGCSNANCGLCKAKLVSGEVKRTRHQDYVFTEAEKGQGCLLMCANTVVSEVVIEAPEAGGAGDLPVQEIPTRVTKLEALDGGVTVLHLKTPRTQRLRFLAGQYVTLTADGISADYSVASCPCDDMRLQFHVRQGSGDPFAHLVDERLAKTDIVTVYGPHGDFVLREEYQRPIVFVAFGTGFAPIRSLIEHAMALEMPQPLYLYWSAAEADGHSPHDGHYLHNLCRSWTDALDDFHYRAGGIDDRLAARIEQDVGDLSQADAYICGDAGAAGDLAGALGERGLPPDRLSTEPLRHG